MTANLESTQSWVNDNAEMHKKFGVHEAIAKLSVADKNTFLKFRLDFILEELKESYKAAGYTLMADVHQVDVPENLGTSDAEEVVDGLIDICVVAIGTLDLLKVDSDKAWSVVHDANMAKEVGVKEGRANPLGLPDLVKPAGWTAPSHEGNHGLLTEMFSN